MFNMNNYVKNIINTHYNKTIGVVKYNLVENEYETLSVSRTLFDIIVCDFVTLGLAYFIFNNL